jgi:hypothetical protein
MTVSGSVADPDHFDTDPDPAYHCDTDPQFDFSLLIRIRIQLFDNEPDPVCFKVVMYRKQYSLFILL